MIDVMFVCMTSYRERSKKCVVSGGYVVFTWIY